MGWVWIKKDRMAIDDRCGGGASRELAAEFECLGLSWAGLVTDLAHGDGSAAWRRNRRTTYMTVSLAMVVLALVALGLLLRRQRGV